MAPLSILYICFCSNVDYSSRIIILLFPYFKFARGIKIFSSLRFYADEFNNKGLFSRIFLSFNKISLKSGQDVSA